MSASTPPLSHGRSLDRYELLYELAAGGMGSVHLARARGIGGFERIVAVKCCHPHLRSDREFAAMFLDEARLAANIHHPNVVATLDVGDDGGLYMVMEYVEGDRVGELARLARERGGSVPVDVALRIMVDALAGLHAAHELRDAQEASLRLVHRDVSPQNILVGVDGVARIADFGIAKAASRATVTREGHVKGKIGYMPPEQLVGDEISRRADVYAAGVVLWEVLTGRRLFLGNSEPETLHKVLAGDVPRPSTVRPDVPPALDAVVLRAVDRDPERRFATAAEFADALEACGVAPASSRALSAYVGAALAEPLRKRREVLRRLTQRRATGTDAPSTPVVAPAASTASRADEVVTATAVSVDAGRPARRAPRVVALAAVAVCSVSATLLAVRFVRTSGHAQAPALATPEQVVHAAAASVGAGVSANTETRASAAPTRAADPPANAAPAPSAVPPPVAAPRLVAAPPPAAPPAVVSDEDTTAPLAAAEPTAHRRRRHASRVHARPATPAASAPPAAVRARYRPDGV